mgnify:CR=1 FL=1
MLNKDKNINLMTIVLNQFDRLPEGLSENLTDALSRIAFVAQELSYIISRGDLGDELQQKNIHKF